MERLITPWRNAYVTATERTEGCVLCRARDGVDGADRLIVHTAELSFVVVNLYPYTGGHVMVAPKRHVGSLGEATVEELAEMMALARRLEEVFRKEYRPDGINLGMNLGRPAGAGVADHIHLHLVPRWTGDTNFMTVVAETRVVPEEPEHTARRLRPYFAR
ncbi:MAG TPA: HIT domain-containing protein [Vicinamibacteria bacterium]|nr:HIT domain-containing protein [Vicinamibacteria bacterium]